VKRIVTHLGAAHRDEVLAIAVLLAERGMVPVERRDPTEQDLADPEVVVVDCGGRHEPSLSNFDHHQLPRDAAPTCALHLVAEWLKLDAVFQLQPWYEFTAVMDSKGPVAAGRLVGLTGPLPKSIWSPIEGAVVSLFAARTEYDSIGFGDAHNGERRYWDPVLEMLALLGRQLIDSARAFAACVESVREHTRIEKLADRWCVFCDAPAQPELLAALDAIVERSGHRVEISITRSDRPGESWTLYRYNDAPGIDFSRVESDSRVVFAHPGGFIAKVREGVSATAARDIAEKSVFSA
jgi:Uncharacterised protein family (UPF0160)